MEFLFFGIGTIIVSFIIEIINELILFKDVADSGYKLDIESMSNISTSKNALLIFLIPIVNIMTVFQRIIQYNNNVRPFLLDQLNVLGCIEEMTLLEKEEYNKNPTGLNAIIISLKLNKEVIPVHSLTFKDNESSSEILFRLDESTEEIKVIHANGFIEKLTIDEQEQLIRKTIAKIIAQDFSSYLKTGKNKVNNLYELKVNEYTIIYKVIAKK